MSVIHNALKQSEQIKSARPSTNFNPLAQFQQNSPVLLYGGIATFFFIATVTVLFFPDAVMLNDRSLMTSSPRLATPVTDSNIDLSSVSVIAEVIETATATSVQQPEPVLDPVSPGLAIPATANADSNVISQQTNELALIADDTPNHTESADPKAALDEPLSNEDKPLGNAAVETSNNTGSLVVSEPTEFSDVHAQPATSSLLAKPSVQSAVIETIKPTQSSAIQEEAEQTPYSSISLSFSKWEDSVSQHINNGDIEKAEAQLKLWIGATPTDPTPRLWLARIYIKNGLYRAATPILAPLNSIESLALKGVVFERLGDFQNAEQIFQQLFRLEPENHRWLLFWAVNAENAQQVAKSVKLYQNYLSLFAYQDEKLTSFATLRLKTIGGAKK